MKSFKIFGLLIVLCGLMAMSGCSEKSHGDGQTGFAVVDFGNGSESWYGDEMYFVDLLAEHGGLNLYLATRGEVAYIPKIEAFILPRSFTIPEVYGENDLIHFDYYSKGYWDSDRSVQDEEGVMVGDWRVESGTVTITSVEDNRVSGSVDLVMYDYYDYRKNGTAIEEVARKPLTVTFERILIKY